MEKYLVQHNERAHRFEVVLEGHIAYVEYELKDKSMDLAHTFVPKPLEGNGIASVLAETALKYAEGLHLNVIPTCPYIKTYLERHPHYLYLVEH